MTILSVVSGIIHDVSRSFSPVSPKRRAKSLSEKQLAAKNGPVVTTTVAPPADPITTKIGFGKFKDKTYTEVPAWYLEWLADTFGGVPGHMARQVLGLPKRTRGEERELARTRREDTAAFAARQREARRHNR